MEKVIYLGLFLVLLSCVSAQDPEITERILPDIKPIGLTGRLNCTVINQMDNSVYWIHADRSLHISNNEKIEIDDSQNIIQNGWPKYQIFLTEDGGRMTYRLVIHHLERTDHGTYTCQILVRGSTKHPTKDGLMLVMGPPSILPSSTTHTVTAAQNDPVNMTCDADGYPSPNISWVRVSGHVLPNGKLRQKGKLLALDKVTTKDRGIYRCLADNAVRPPAVFDVTLFVTFPPVSKAIQSSYGQAENRMFDVTLECRVAGWPEPNLQWYKVLKGGNSFPIDNDDKHTVNILLNHANILGQQERWFQLVVRTVQANDFGDYLCEGRNNMGVDQARINLFATSECQGPNCLEEQKPEKNAVTSPRPSSMTTASFAMLGFLYFLCHR